MFKKHAPNEGQATSWRRGGRLLPGILLATSMATAGSLATAGPAAADVSDCTFTNTVCLYSGDNFTGERQTLTSLNSSGICVNQSDGWVFEANSVFNTNTLSAAMFFNPDCVGDPFQVPPNSGVAQLNTFTPQSIWIPGR